jgi:hypothetical protein
MRTLVVETVVGQERHSHGSTAADVRGRGKARVLLISEICEKCLLPPGTTSDVEQGEVD